MEEMHIGTEIRKLSKKRGMGTTFIAKQLDKTRGNVHHIFTRKGIDSDLLFRLSLILDFNFFDLYSDSLRSNSGLEKGLSKNYDEDSFSELIETQKKNSDIQRKYIDLLEEKIERLRAMNDQRSLARQLDDAGTGDGVCGPRCGRCKRNSGRHQRVRSSIGRRAIWN